MKKYAIKIEEYSESAFQPLIRRIVIVHILTTNFPHPSSRRGCRACRKKSRIAVPHTIRLSRGIPAPFIAPRFAPRLTPPPSLALLPLPCRALEQSMEIITLMASPTRERGTTRAPPLPSSLARKAALEWERSRHLDGNVTLPAPPLTPRRELYRMARSHHLARRGAARREQTRASFLRHNGVMPFSTR